MPLQLCLVTHWEHKKQGSRYQQVGSLDSRLGTMPNGSRSLTWRKPRVVHSDEFWLTHDLPGCEVQVSKKRMWSSVQAPATMTQAKKVDYIISIYQPLNSPNLADDADHRLTVWTPISLSILFFDLLGIL
jgi:hypothetical protein